MQRAALPALLLALVLTVSTGANCPGGSSGCPEFDTPGTATFLNTGASTSIEAPDCNTCGHASATVTWGSVVGAAAGTGTVLLAMNAVCTGNGIVSFPASATADWIALSASIGDQGVKNLCGENAPVSWRAVVTNNTGTPIDNVRLTITCPRKTGGSPTTP